MNYNTTTRGGGSRLDADATMATSSAEPPPPRDVEGARATTREAGREEEMGEGWGGGSSLKR